MMNAPLKKILVVEDENAVARFFELKLVNAGFSVKVANNGEEALVLLEQESFDLVFLDLIMPKLDGFGVLERLLTRGAPSPPVVVTSSLRQDTDRERALTLGAKDYFVKSDTALADIVAYAKKLLT